MAIAHIMQISDMARRECKVPRASNNIFFKAFLLSKKPQALLSEAICLASSPKNVLSLEKAARKINLAIKSGLETEEIFSQLAMVYLKMGKIPRAAAVAERACTVGYVDTSNFIYGMAYLTRGLNDLAGAKLAGSENRVSRSSVNYKLSGGEVRSINIDPETRMMELAHSAKQNFQCALDCFAAAKQTPITKFNQAYAFQMLSQYTAAIEKYQEILGMPVAGLSQNLLSSVHNNMGVCYYKGCRQIEKAELEFRASIACNTISSSAKNLSIINGDAIDVSARANLLRPVGFYIDIPDKAHQ